MTYGVVQNRTLLDYYIDHWCTQKAARLEPVVACLLRLGIYQILFMDKVPDPGCCSRDSRADKTPGQGSRRRHDQCGAAEMCVKQKHFTAIAAE